MDKLKVDNTLLEKYYNGFCTKGEQDIVESWLASNSFDANEILDLPANESKIAHKEKMWQNLSQDFPKPVVKVIPFYKRTAISLAAAASIVFAIFLSGVFKVDSSATTAFGQLEIASGNGIIVSVDANSGPVKICFDGYIQFVNRSTATTTITYGDEQEKAFQLAPGKTYYMWKFKDTSYLFNEDDLPLNEDPARHLRGKFSVECTTV